MQARIEGLGSMIVMSHSVYLVYMVFCDERKKEKERGVSRRGTTITSFVSNSIYILALLYISYLY